MSNLQYHPKLREIIYALDYSKIGSKKQLSGWYSSATHPGYAGATIFEGHGSTNDLWISVNIIEKEDYLFLHTSLQLSPSAPLQNEINKFSSLQQTTTLIRVGALQRGVKQLVQDIDNRILPYL